jgi:signal transduction histidine kinase
MRVWQRSIGGVPIADAVLAAVLVVAAAGAVAQSSWSARTVADLVVSCVMAATVGLRRRAPLVMAAVFAAGLLALAAIDQGGTTMWAFVALLVVSFSTTSELAHPMSTWAIGLLAVAGVVYDATVDHNGVGSVLSPVVIIGAPAAAGVVVRRSRRQAADLARLAADLAEQQEAVRAAAVLGERTRIARELHDVIAHTVGVMVVQAGAAEKQLSADDPAMPTVQAIRHTGKEAMQELRLVVGLLRTDDEPEVEPQPGVEALADLVEVARRSGPVEADLDETPVLAPGPALTVYRTVQEALTNARRHAPGARVSVCVGRHGDRLHVEVTDDGSSDHPPIGPAGFGLVGLRERAALYGGTLEAGPREHDRGWRVSLVLPLDDEAGPHPVVETWAAVEPA